MKELSYRFYGFIFNIMKLFPLRKKKILIYMIYNSNFKDNLKCFYDEMKRRDPSFYFVIVSKRELFHSNSRNRIIRIIKLLLGTIYFYIGLNYHFATSEYICLNNNFLPLAYMDLKKETKLLQFWHGVGAFKKFGLSTEPDANVRKLVSKGNQQIDYLFVSSANNIPYYVEAMGIKPEHIHATGAPVTDYYFQNSNYQKALKKLNQRYPETIGKKIILYAPTFRKTERENEMILKQFDSDRLIRELGDDYIVLIRMHPQKHPQARKISSHCIDMTDYEDVKDLYFLSELLITDYSSVMVEYSLLNHPIIFYAYDLEQYDRGFYDPYEEMVPGVIVKTMDELTAKVKVYMNTDFDQKRAEFLSRQYDYLDGQSTKRVVDLILGTE